MITIRMQRIGRRNEPHYRIVVIESTRGPKSGKSIEELGHYNPKLGVVEITADRAKYWLSVGARPSDTVHNMLVSKGILVADKRRVSAPRKTKKK